MGNIACKFKVMQGLVMAIRILVASFVILGFFVLYFEDATAEVYKWVDEEGIVHYSDNPPQDAESERMQLPSTPGPKGDPSEILRRRLEQAEKAKERRSEERLAASAAKEGKRAARVARDQRCLETRMQLAVLQEQRPVYRDEQGQFRLQWVRDPYSGEREYINDAMRASEVARAHQEIATSCQHPDDTEEQDLARAMWIRSEYCAAARVELEQLEQRGATVRRDQLEQKRQMVNSLCEK